MVIWLDSITTGIALTTITVSIWLGLFLVTRAGHSRRVWLAALTVWAVGSWFLYNVLQISLPNYGKLIWLLWFGQTIKFAPILWFQLSYQLRLDSGTLGPWQKRIGRLVVITAYALTSYNVWDTSRNFGIAPFPDEVESYILFLILLIILPLWTMWNFYQARTQTRLPIWRRQLLHLLVATAVAYMGGLYAGFAIYFQWEIPFFPSRAILGIGIILLGYGVVKYDALLEGRSIERDALYSSVGTALVTLAYALVAWILWITGAATIPAVATFLICVVITHTLYDGGRALLDRIFYRGHLRRLRTDLRHFARETATGHSLSEQLDLVLETVCQTIGVQQGLIAIRHSLEAEFEVMASRESRWRGRQLSAADLTANEVVDLLAMKQPSAHEFEQMATLVPLGETQFQIGALILGNKVSGAPYYPQDLEYLESVGHQLAAMIEAVWQQEAHVKQLELGMKDYLAREKNLQHQMQQLVAAPAPLSAASLDLDEDTMALMTEDALRHLNDYTYLGAHQFAELQVVSRFLPASAGTAATGSQGVTYLDRGKALHGMLIHAIQQLRPTGVEPSPTVVPTREWHNFLILHDSYLKGELTRDIMARLYIGEGTYNRTRRRALRSIGKLIQEMERKASQDRVGQE
jgi:hypothetical protein